MLKLRKNKKGFTLVELIVVIAIMAVLAGTIAGVTVSQLNKQTNNTAKSEAQTLASDLHNFMIDYTLPAGTGTDGKTPPVTPGTENTVFTMPSNDTIFWNSKDGITNVYELTYAVLAFVDENKQGDNIEVITVDGTTVTAVPTGNGTIEGNDNNFKAGDHKFYAFVYSEPEKDDNGEDKKDSDGKVITHYKVRFCCKQKGNGNNQFPFADYTYSDVLADK